MTNQANNTLAKAAFRRLLNDFIFNMPRETVDKLADSESKIREIEQEARYKINKELEVIREIMIV